MKYFGYILGARRWFFSFLFLTMMIAFPYYGCFQHFIQKGLYAQNKQSFIYSYDFGLLVLFELAGLIFLYILLNARRENFSSLGLSFQKKDFTQSLYIFFSILTTLFLLGIVLSIVFSFLNPEQVEKYLPQKGKMEDFQAAFLNSSLTVLIPVFAFNAIFEELIMRAFLMTELNAWLKKGAFSIFISAFVQAGYHLYEGLARGVIIFFVFLFFSIYYHQSKRITPLILSHAYIDISAVLLLILYAKIYSGPH